MVLTARSPIGINCLRCRPPGWIPGGVASVVNGGELSTEALQRREEPDLGWVMRHGAAPPE